ncbi:MAG TPA: FKBP-type peptidyl-prolyl cis-trans isomerase [Pedobacter sp.]|jgi:FKBP-type peptidyl-prolyl cis-trans isomerase
MKLIFFLKFFCLVALIGLFSSGCKKEYATIEQLDNEQIEAYLKQNNLTAKKSANGTYYVSINRGTGAAVEYTEMVPLIYTFKTVDGQFASVDTFANRYGATGQYLGYLGPEGLRIAVKDSLKFRGGSMKIIIPSNLAFGRNGNGQVPGNASLEYTVKVLDTAKAKLQAYDQISIDKYKTANNLTGFTKTAEGVHYKIIEQGTGSPITPDSIISVQFTGRLLNGKVFDEANGTLSRSSVLSERIPGWVKTIPLIQGGGSIRVIIPSGLAYGLAGNRNTFTGTLLVPSASCLDFDIKVLDVSQP